MDKQVTQAGQVNIIACDILQGNGAGLEVTALVERITIFEDLFSPFISGELVLRDTFDIPNTIGRSSRDLLRLVINTPSLPTNTNIQGYFLIYKLVDRQLASDRSQLYTYRFCSEEMVYDVQRRISKTYRGAGDKIISEIVSKKLGSAKKMNSDSPKNEIAYTSNFWSPTQNIRYITENSMGGTDDASFIFYENRDGFNFKSLTKLAKQDDLMQLFVASDFIADVETSNAGAIRFGAASRNPNNDYSIIREIRVDSTFDYLDFINRGGSRTILYTHDLVTKRIDIQKFDLEQENHSLLNTSRHMTSSVVTNTEPLVMTASKHWGVLDPEDKTNTKFIQKRISQLAQYQSFKIEVDVFGRCDYTVGKKVYVDVNQIRAISRDEDKDLFLDKLYSGYYLVSKVAHHITRKEHMATIELIKDSTLLK
jgi:hypothetical protein